MPNAPGQRNKQSKINSRWLPELDRLLLVGMKQGPAAKHDAINKVLQLAPELTRGNCWRRIGHLRRIAELAALEAHHHDKAKKAGKTNPVRRPHGRPWTTAADDKLLRWAGVEPVARIAQRLRRSVPAVRFRLGALGMTAKVTDGCSLRELRKMLRVSRARLRRLIADGMLRVRDPRVTISSLAAFCDRNRPSLDVSAIARITAALAKGDGAYSWERAADLLGVSLAKIRSLVSGGQLKVADTFVTDRSFDEFCKNHGDELNIALLDPATAKWLVSEYGVPNLAEKGQSLSGSQKHALVIRTCKCGKQIAGNPYFKHIKYCSVATKEEKSQAV